ADVAFAAGTVRLTWVPASDPDRLGYHVFRATAGGVSVRITPDIIHHADFYDTGTLPNTHYDYKIVVVDSSLLWSLPSPTLGVNTIAASLPGWPITVVDPTASSVAVGDIDGDGGMEIVVGDRGVWAWHADGREVRDGDGDPTTVGVFSLLPGT